MFTDIEGSTRLWRDQPEEMASALAEHDGIVRRAVEGRRGMVFSTAGDGFAAAFWTAEEAAAAAEDIQSVMGASEGRVTLRVRIGLHTGTATERDDDYFGPTLNRAARIMAVGNGGQVLCSEVTARLLVSADVHPLGSFRLKDLAGTERIWQVGGALFAALRAERVRAGNLPVGARSFIGRSEERAKLADALAPGRLITLTGPGGVGKTRLILEVARDVGDRFEDGVWWFDLAPIEDSAAVASAVAATLAAMMAPGAAPTDAVVDSLQGRRTLVVFDNCEHLVAAASTLIDAVLDRCPTVSAAATFASAVGRRGRDGVARPATRSRIDGAKLFLERARATDASTFAVSDSDASVVELCRHLDGLPLAIELAAGQVRVMTIDELLERLDDRSACSSAPASQHQPPSQPGGNARVVVQPAHSERGLAARPALRVPGRLRHRHG